MEEKRIDDIELYLASDEPVEVENEPITDEVPVIEPESVKKDTPKAVRVGEVPKFRERNKKRFKMDF